MANTPDQSSGMWMTNSPRGVEAPGGADGNLPPGLRTEELGIPGLKGARPLEGWLYDEFLPQLRGLRGAQIFRQMADNDPILGAALFTFKMLLRNVKWSVIPADESDAAAQAKDWAESVFFKDMHIPFGDMVSDILSMLQYGFAPAEVTYKIRRGKNKKDRRKSSLFTDNTIGIMKISVRAQDTVWRWHFDNYGDVTYLEQWRIGLPNAMIPAEKLLLFKTENTLNNPEGRSLLRNCYTTFLRKGTIEEAEGRTAIRNAGIVVMGIPMQYLMPGLSGDDAAVANAYKSIADKVARDELGSVVLPSDVDPNTKAPLVTLKYVTAEGQRPVDMSAIVERYDKRMLSAMLADFILLGQQSTGSFALSDNKTAMFGKACGAVLSNVEDQLNRVELTRLWEYNAFDEAVKPRLKPGDLEAVDLDRLGMFILRLAQAGMPLFPDPKLEAEIRDIGGLPAPALEQG